MSRWYTGQEEMRAAFLELVIAVRNQECEEDDGPRQSRVSKALDVAEKFFTPGEIDDIEAAEYRAEVEARNKREGKDPANFSLEALALGNPEMRAHVERVFDAMREGMKGWPKSAPVQTSQKPETK